MALWGSSGQIFCWKWDIYVCTSPLTKHFLWFLYRKLKIESSDFVVPISIVLTVSVLETVLLTGLGLFHDSTILFIIVEVIRSSLLKWKNRSSSVFRLKSSQNLSCMSYFWTQLPFSTNSLNISAPIVA